MDILTICSSCLETGCLVRSFEHILNYSVESLLHTKAFQTVKPIFHQNKKYLASGTFASPNRKIVLLCHITQGYQQVGIFCVRWPKFLASAPTPTQGSSGVGHVYFMYISCIFHVVCAPFSALATRELADAKADSSGIWA